MVVSPCSSMYWGELNQLIAADPLLRTICICSDTSLQHDHHASYLLSPQQLIMHFSGAAALREGSAATPWAETRPTCLSSAAASASKSGVGANALGAAVKPL